MVKRHSDSESCWCCTYKCPNSGDLDMEPSRMYYWVKDLMVPQQSSAKKGWAFLPMSQSHSLHCGAWYRTDTQQHG